MDTTQRLIESIEREKILRARATSPGHKIEDSLEMSDLVLDIMMAGVRAAYPDATDEERIQILEERLRRVRDTGATR